MFFFLGSCEEFANATFRCRCSPGWEGDHCEKRINRCKNVTCENRGVCRSMLLDYQCECLGESYSGRHCEIVSTKTMALQTFSKSVSYVCIIIIISFVLFIVAMDVLKYGFGIDPVANERKVQRKVQQRPRPRMAVHHIYVN